MTTTSLTRANEIHDEIRELKNAIVEVNRNNFINESSRSCSGYSVSPFLSNLHVEIKTYAVKQITDRIFELEKEFSGL